MAETLKPQDTFETLVDLHDTTRIASSMPEVLTTGAAACYTQSIWEANFGKYHMEIWKTTDGLSDEVPKLVDTEERLGIVAMQSDNPIRHCLYLTADPNHARVRESDFARKPGVALPAALGILGIRDTVLLLPALQELTKDTSVKQAVTYTSYITTTDLPTLPRTILSAETRYASTDDKKLRLLKCSYGDHDIKAELSAEAEVPEVYDFSFTSSSSPELVFGMPTPEVFEKIRRNSLDVVDRIFELGKARLDPVA